MAACKLVTFSLLMVLICLALEASAKYHNKKDRATTEWKGEFLGQKSKKYDFCQKSSKTSNVRSATLFSSMQTVTETVTIMETAPIAEASENVLRLNERSFTITSKDVSLVDSEAPITLSTTIYRTLVRSTPSGTLKLKELADMLKFKPLPTTKTLPDATESNIGAVVEKMLYAGDFWTRTVYNGGKSSVGYNVNYPE